MALARSRPKTRATIARLPVVRRGSGPIPRRRSPRIPAAASATYRPGTASRAIREFAAQQFGPMAKSRAPEWGICRCEIRRNRLQHGRGGLAGENQPGQRADFANGYDFDTAFRKSRPAPKQTNRPGLAASPRRRLKAKVSSGDWMPVHSSSAAPIPPHPPGVKLLRLENGADGHRPRRSQRAGGFGQRWCNGRPAFHEGNGWRGSVARARTHALQGHNTRPGSRIDQEVQEAGGYMTLTPRSIAPFSILRPQHGTGRP